MPNKKEHAFNFGLAARAAWARAHPNEGQLVAIADAKFVPRDEDKALLAAPPSLSRLLAEAIGGEGMVAFLGALPDELSKGFVEGVAHMLRAIETGGGSSAARRRSRRDNAWFACPRSPRRCHAAMVDFLRGFSDDFLEGFTRGVAVKARENTRADA